MKGGEIMQDCLEVIVKHTGANNCLFSFGNAIKQAACGIVVLDRVCIN